jgi:hypothetical protein
MAIAVTTHTLALAAGETVGERSGQREEPHNKWWAD